MEHNENKNYDLKSEAVEQLLDTEETPEYSQEELEKYRSKKKIRISDLVKVLIIKAWFAGAVCYFIFWGLSNYMGNLIDMLFALAVVLGMVTDLLTNNVIRFFEKTTGDHDKWIMFPKKGYMSFVWNILYGFVILLGVYTLYNAINMALNGILGTTGATYLGVEPVLFGVFCMGFDMLLIAMKQMLRQVFEDAKKAAGKPGNNS